MSFAPILLFTYNRLSHTQRCVEALSQNQGISESELFIYSDGAKDASQKASVMEVRNYLHTIQGFKHITIIEREDNWGLARNIIDGVTTQVNKYGRVIVLEDDLIVAPYFLQFMNDALETYKDEPKVGHIQACDFTQDTSLPDTFLIKWTGSWGWGTWDRAWKHFNPNGKELLQKLAVENNLVLSGGSDYHGSRHPDLHLGCGSGNLHVPGTICQALQQRASKYKTNEFDL